MRRGTWYVLGWADGSSGFMVLGLNKRFCQGNAGAQIGYEWEAHEMTVSGLQSTGEEPGVL